MSEVPPASVIRKTTKSVVEDAHAEGNMSDLTIRIVRGMVEEKLGLESGALDPKELRNIVKKAITEAQENLPTGSQKEKAGSPEVEGAAVDSSEEKTQDKKPSSTRTAKKRQRPEKVSKGKFKSGETVQSSDEEGAENPTPKKKKKQAPTKKKKTVESDHESEPHDDLFGSPLPTRDVSEEEASDPGLSSDTAPPKSKKAKKESKKSSSKEKAPAKSKKGSKEKEPLSKDEATIKRLKGFVLACGVRKVWGVWFKDSPEPSQQIRKLRELLHELGMKERFTMEQAKRIKQKRELAQELEDVQTFEKSIKARDRRNSRGARIFVASDEELEDIQNVKSRRKNALQSINAFLDSQSEDEN